MMRVLQAVLLATMGTTAQAALYTVTWQDPSTTFSVTTDTSQFQYALTPYLEVSGPNIFAVHQYLNVSGHEMFTFFGNSTAWQTLNGTNSIGFGGWLWSNSSISVTVTAAPLVAAIPEPATVALFASGLVALVATRKRRTG